METINDNNYEQWLLRYAEDDLSAAERAEVEAWLESHPDAAEELALYSEAPRLEKDESVRYVAVPRQHTQPLWPMAVRWCAAAAVVAALMVPALRMGTMEVAEGPLTAGVERIEGIDSIERIEGIEAIGGTERIEDLSVKPVRSIKSIESIASIASIESIASTPSTLTQESAAQPEIIPVNTLIAIEEPLASVKPLATSALIVYEEPDWGDMLLAANDAFRDNLGSTPIGQRLANTLPDSRQLEETIVEPLRTRIENIRNIIR